MNSAANTTLLRGGRIYTPTAPDATAMAVTGDTIVWVGQDTPGTALYGDSATVIDLDGAFVTPAFVDAHVHATSAGLLLGGLDLTSARSLPECLRLVREHVRQHPGALVWGHGWEETGWPEMRPPTRAELDEVAGETPVYLSRIDVHSALVSTTLLRQAPGAEQADGWSPDGPLAREAHHHVRTAAMSSLDRTQRRRIQQRFLRQAASLGIATVHECAGPAISSQDDLRELLTLSAEGGVPEVVGYWGEAGALETARRLGAHGAGGDLFVDGALGSRTACLHEPYTDDPATSGALYLDAEAVAEHLVACTHGGMQGGFHVIGDAAVAEVVAGFALAEREVGRAALAARGHRLEHLEMVTAEQARQLAGWGVIASMQPLFDEAWGGSDRQYAHRLGLPRGAGLNPFSAVAAAGMPLALGSDVPVTPLGPWQAVRAAVHHRTDGFGISPRAAFTAHTRGGHRAAGDRDEYAGTLQPGAPATYAVWDAGELVVATPDTRAQRWSTDPRSGVGGLPSLEPGTDLPRCTRTVLRGEEIYPHPGS